MEQMSFLERVKLNVTFDFLQGILCLFAALEVYYFFYWLFPNSSTAYFGYSSVGAFVAGSFIALVYLALAIMLLRHSRQWVKFLLVVLVANLAFDLMSFFSDIWFNPPPHENCICCDDATRAAAQAEYGLFYTSAKERWGYLLFAIACSVWFLEKPETSPSTEQRLLPERTKPAVTSDFLRGFLFMSVAATAYGTVFSFMRGDKSYVENFTMSDTWIATVIFAVVGLACLAIAVVLLMQTRSYARFTLVALIIIFAVELLQFFLMPLDPQQRFAERISYHVLCWWAYDIFFIALAAWFYKKSGKNIATKEGVG